ncbi:MAG: DUF2130 domain-containing protein, partial [Candidatus Nomurabacteria bacterium]|nr:DUF2130 domain-containing protein [Candidatus Nomurabacteria bacterium]
MNEIKCPHCGEKFKIDEANYANILKQVRDGEFEKELHERLADVKKLATVEAQSALKDELAKKDAEIAAKEKEISEIKSTANNHASKLNL